MSRTRRPSPPKGRSGGGSAVEPDPANTRTFRIALARLPGRLRQATRLFHELTGLAAVTSIRSASVDTGKAGQIAPPVHPRCASVLRVAADHVPCEEEWRRHLSTGQRSRAVQSHVCSLGLRCSCVPIFFGGTLVGVAKLVVGPETAVRRVAVAVRALEMVVARACQDFYVSTLTEELAELRHRLAELQKLRGGAALGPGDRSLAAAAISGTATASERGPIVRKVLDYLDAHYLDPELSLTSVSRELRVNEKYLTHLFTQVVGQRMRAHIVELRLQHACRKLRSSDGPIKQIAYESGFRRPDRFRRVFRRQVGVAPSTYRRIFAQG